MAAPLPHACLPAKQATLLSSGQVKAWKFPELKHSSQTLPTMPAQADPPPTAEAVDLGEEPLIPTAPVASDTDSVEDPFSNQNEPQHVAHQDTSLMMDENGESYRQYHTAAASLDAFIVDEFALSFLGFVDANNGPTAPALELDDHDDGDGTRTIPEFWTRPAPVTAASIDQDYLRQLCSTALIVGDTPRFET